MTPSPGATGAGDKGDQEGKSPPSAVLSQGRNRKENPNCALLQSWGALSNRHIIQSHTDRVREPGRSAHGIERGWSKAEGTEAGLGVRVTESRAKQNHSGRAQIRRPPIPYSPPRFQKRPVIGMFPTGTQPPAPSQQLRLSLCISLFQGPLPHPGHSLQNLEPTVKSATNEN